MEITEEYSEGKLVKRQTKLKVVDANGRYHQPLAEAIVQDGTFTGLKGVYVGTDGIFYIEKYLPETNPKYIPSMQQFTANAELQQRTLSDIMSSYSIFEAFNRIAKKLAK